MLNTGVGVKEYIEFLEDSRRSMDRMIDSFRIEYAIQGGDTLQIPDRVILINTFRLG